ncbi:EAL domain-containing protein [Clostridium sp. AWRP]|uniref:EAL domain-containing protein n=1 Tax=Clostridium sp. AWRP TaxID=2212991 RepID=UPI001FA96CA7|nr:EAL domain-containing protein [Clostridium sp. AWRP]
MRMKVGAHMAFVLADVINISELKNLMERFYSITSIACYVKDISGEVLNINSQKYIHIFDKLGDDKKEEYILNQIINEREIGVFEGYGNLVYIGIPITINEEHIGTIFLNPVFLQKSDKDCFKVKFEKFNFDEGKYKLLIKNTPVISERYIEKITQFFHYGLILAQKTEDGFIMDLDTNKKLNQSYVELFGIYEQLCASEQQLRSKYDGIKKLAYYDQLTNLPNWNLFKKEVEKRIEKKSGDNFSIFQIDLDNFKNINDIFGYEYGDKLLRKTGEVLSQLHLGMVAKMGGSEFLILKNGYDNKRHLENIAQCMINTISGLWNIDGTETLISVTVGITVYPRDGEEVATLLRNADIALNRTKLIGKNSYKLFEKSMYNEILKKVEMEKELRKAIKNNEFILYYQPQVDMENTKVVGFEALIRWNSPKLGWVMPLEFINLAEETGLIIPIGEWVLKTACSQNKIWKDNGYSYDFISINVSPIQLKEDNFAYTVKKVLEETELKPEYLEIEITESVMMESLESNLKVINELKNIGVKVALDDFGSGYSSLNYLKSIPINTLKIDKTFIDGICSDYYEDIITEEIIKLAHRMKLEVVAEGVEEEDQIESLKGKNCNKIQGYYFGKPMPSEDIKDFLKKQL